MFCCVTQVKPIKVYPAAQELHLLLSSMQVKQFEEQDSQLP